jgi:uncharacterized protein RhaS with RHS repeats
MLNRYYSATTKKFISTDPMGIDGGANLYAYGNLNPLAFVDPYGLEAQGADEIHDYFKEKYGAVLGSLANLLFDAAYHGFNTYKTALDAGFTEEQARAMGGAQAAGEAAFVSATIQLSGQAVANAPFMFLATGATSGEIYASRGGTLNGTIVEEIRQSMTSGTYDFSSAANRIGGYIDSNGNYMIGEGHHRMQAAVQSGSVYVQQLLQNGLWTQVQKFPTTPMPMPPVNQ